MKTDLTSEPSPMYIGSIDGNFRERHISLVPYVPGLEAICGQQVKVTRAAPWRMAVTSATCPTCRARGIEIAGRLWADGRPPRGGRT